MCIRDSKEPVTNRGYTTFYDKKAGVWRQPKAQQMMAQDPESKNPDIGRAGQISGVPEFLKEDIMYQPLPHARPETPYAATGSNPSAHDSEGNPYAFAQVRPKKDIGEVGVDAEVHGFVKANNMVSPVSNWRPDSPYAYNGSAEKGWGTTVVPGEVTKYAQRERPHKTCLLYTSPSPRDGLLSRMPSSA